MNSHRAAYLRRVAPLLGRNRCPRCRKAALVTEQINITYISDPQPRYVPGRTTCPRCQYDATSDHTTTNHA